MRVLIRRGGCPPGGWEAGKRVRLDDAEVHHLRVRRAREQEQVEVLDGAGLRGAGHLIRAERDWLVELESVHLEPRLPELVLAVGAGDRERFAWLVEKSAEIGVTWIVPLETAHTAGVGRRLKSSHLSRLRHAALEALKQSGAAWVPTVEDPVQLEEFLRRPRAGAGWLADADGGPTPATLNSGPLTIMVGPEGGFSESERAEIIGAGFSPIVLSAFTLRFETAALTAAAAAAQARLRRIRG
jgi:16S rRNA (uracil1498-N3)-methyltransferase